MSNENKSSDKKEIVGNRRDFFKMLFSQAFSFLDEFKEKPPVTIPEMWELSEKEIEEIKPQVSPYAEIILEEKTVNAKHTDRKEPFFIFDNKEENILIFNSFNGDTPIKDIKKKLLETMKWDSSRSLTYIKNLYINLVSLGVCIPPDIKKD